jgi:hypothetical protein
MKNPLLILLIAVSLSVTALALTFVNRNSAGSQAEAESVAVAHDPSDSLLLRVEDLWDENRALRDRLSALELRPLPASSSRVPVVTGFATLEEFEAFRDEVRELLDERKAIPAELANEPDGFKDHVASTLAEIRQEESVEKARAWQEEGLERLEESMPKFDTWLELTPYQSEQMRSALLVQYDRNAELTRRWEAGEDTQVLGEVKRTDREAHLTELSVFLTPEQLEVYSAPGSGSGK